MNYKRSHDEVQGWNCVEEINPDPLPKLGAFPAQGGEENPPGTRSEQNNCINQAFMVIEGNLIAKKKTLYSHDTDMNLLRPQHYLWYCSSNL